MKKNFFNVIFSTATAVILFFSSCEKQLNVLPTTKVVDGNLITDSISARNALNGVYYRFANAGEDFNGAPALRWMNVNEIFQSNLVGTIAPSGGDDGTLSFVFNETDGSVSSLWSYGYGIVNAANGFLSNIEETANISASAKKQMLAEAKFLRAYANEKLLLNFGQYYDPNSTYGIIIRQDATDSKSIQKARSTVAESYESILADLEEAIEGLPVLNSSKIYANRGAAKLLKAQVLLNRGTEQDMTDVVALCNDIIAYEPFALEPNSKDIFYVKGFSSSEVLLGVQPYPSQNWKFMWYNTNGTYSVYENGVKLLTNDPRSSWYYRFDDGNTNMGSYLGGINAFTKYYNGSLLRGQAVRTTQSELSYAFRLSSAYLYKAEALANLNQDIPAVKEALKTILKAAGFTDFSEVDNTTDAGQLKFLIIKEQIKNFMGENGEDWNALRRLPLDQLKLIQPNMPDVTRLILPIPYNERTKNNLVIPNPGYN